MIYLLYNWGSAISNFKKVNSWLSPVAEAFGKGPWGS